MQLDPLKDSYRCAIYTRKSVLGRADQEYNSIESQYDICSAYIRSQVHKGWRQLSIRYDDLGRSGGNLDRPALQLLLSDIERGAIDVVVVYKIDRLTRSLRDFIRLLEVFERNGVAIVSITQSFDTNDTLGRLLLNILLTFAQFEREMLADRIRDKQRAMKERGLWTGGQAPYGYDLANGYLVVNEAEAAIVRLVFRQFIDLKCYNAVTRNLQALGIRNKPRISKAGRVLWDNPISCGTVHHILGNIFYVGGVPGSKIIGRQAPIIDRETWECVQELRLERTKFKIHRGASPNFLLSLLYDSLGRPMTIHEGWAKGRDYRYYISNRARWAEQQHQRRFRVNASAIEELVKSALVDVMCDRERLRSMLLKCGVHGLDLEALGEKGRAASAIIRSPSLEKLGLVVKALVGRVELSREHVSIVLRCRQFERFLRWRGTGHFTQDRRFGETEEATELLTIAANLVRCERSLFLPMPENGSSAPNARLTSLLDDARRAKHLLEVERLSIPEIAAQMGYKSNSRVARTLRLNYLAPDIIMSIICGSQPPDLDRAKLIRANLPLDWSLQRRLLGLPERAPIQMGEERY